MSRSDASYEERVAAQLAALLTAQGDLPPRRRPLHPETGCPCVDCTERDDYLESVAERRADERRGYYC